MSTSAPPQLAAEVAQTIPRTRLQPIGGSGKSIYIAAVCLALSVVGALASRSYSKGGTVSISSNVPGALVRIDSVARSADPSGAAQFANVPFGLRSVRIEQRDFEPLSTTLGAGWLSGNQFSFQLKPIPLTLTVNTMPGAEVLLNGQSAGTANNQGMFVKSDVLPGDYEVQVRLTGYNTFNQKRHLSPKFEQIYAGLNVSQERIQQIQEEQRRAQENAARFQQLVGSARQQFNSRQYQAALSSVESALKLDPGNTGAQQLKNQIVQTINILGK